MRNTPSFQQIRIDFQQPQAKSLIRPVGSAMPLATRLRREAIASSSGTYEIPDLPTGLYRVACTAASSQDGMRVPQ